ncbi:hypothetical protein Tco_1131924 [Tanacetum coccineum]|uniref:Uncharacterized protein n=1 Tax=Tanacetum coccineum TaxID=301880 RepID=A0ABQ5JDJ6_9ASTR
MRELREDTFSENKNEDAHDHIDQVLSIVGLFNILKDLLKKAFIHRYYLPSKTAKQLEDIHNFKQEGDESLYQAWERYNDMLYKCPTHDINSHQKDDTSPSSHSKIQTMADHSQKWHDGMTSRNVRSSKSGDELAALDGCQICEGPRLNKDYPLNEEVKQVEEVRYGEFGRTTPFNESNGGKFRVGPPGYYTKTDNRPPYVIADHEVSMLNNLHGVSFISENESTPEVLQWQLPPKELNPGSFTLPCTIDMSRMAPLGIVENILLKIDKFLFLSDFDDSAIVNNPIHRRFDDYKWEFNLEIDKLADEYELGIGKKGRILDNIWEYCNQVHNNNYGWHNHRFKEEEREEMGGQSFVCVSKDLDDVLPLGRNNGSKFKEMVRKEDPVARRHLSRPTRLKIMWKLY